MRKHFVSLTLNRVSSSFFFPIVSQLLLRNLRNNVEYKNIIIIVIRAQFNHREIYAHRQLLHVEW